MSFNKRFYNKESILSFRDRDFNDFENWIFKPDAHLYSDGFSEKFITHYMDSDDDIRAFLFECISNSTITDLDSLELIKTKKNG